MLKFIGNIIAAQRNAKALTEARAELFDLEAKAKCIIAHAIGGGHAVGLDDGLNDICVEISACRNRIYNEARDMERMASAGIKGALAHLSEAERKVLGSMEHVWGRKLATIATETGLMDADVRAIVKVFVHRGLAEFGALYNDGELAGRGYYLTDAGAAMQRAAA